MRNLMIICSILLSSCVLDIIYPLAKVSNVSNTDIVITMYLDNNDTSLFYGEKHFIPKDSTIQLMNQRLDQNEDITFNFFIADTVYSRMKTGRIEGISKSSFLKSITISTDSLQKNNYIIYR